MASRRTRWSAPDYQKELETLAKNKLETGEVTKDSVDSTRRMLQLVDECQDAGINTLRNLHHQGEALDRTEGQLDEMDNNLDDGGKALKKMERLKKVPLFLLPCYFCCCSSKPKPSKSSLKKEKVSRNSLRTQPEPKSSQNLKNSEIGLKDVNNNPSIYSRHRKSNTNRGMPFEKTRYFEPITGEKEEDEIEDNLDKVSSYVSSLKSQAHEMGNTVSKQNKQLDKMNEKAESNQSKMSDLTNRTVKLIDSDSSNSVSASCCPCGI